VSASCLHCWLAWLAGAAFAACVLAACSGDGGPAGMRTLEQLIDRAEPGIVQVHEWIAKATNAVEVLPADRAAGERALLALQVTSRSPLGAIALETGGLLIDGGWIRVLGSGHERLPRAIDTWNGLGGAPRRLPGALLVGDDAVGGFFAWNGDGLPGERGHVLYLAPDTLRWESVAESYSAWLWNLLTMDTARFYEGSRWTTWRDDARTLPGDCGFSVQPFLWAAGPPVDDRSRRAVPIAELWGLHAVDLPRQLGR
jgi:hypothetical protein